MICEGCRQEKEVTDVDGNLLCDECTEDIIRCECCKKFLAINFDDMIDNLGRPNVPELHLPDKQTSMFFCDTRCLKNYINSDKVK